MRPAAPTQRSRRAPTGDAAPDRLRTAALVVVGLSPLALGGTHPWAEVAVWFAAIALLGVHTFRAARRDECRAIPATSVVLALVAIVTLVRATPFGAFLASAQVSDAWALWPELAPRGTAAPTLAAMAALRLAGLAAVVRLGASLFAARTDRIPLGLAVLAGAGASLLLGVAQELTGSSRVLFVYEPAQVERAIHALSGPFVNPNQAGALGAIAAVLAAFGALRIAEGPVRIALGAASFAFAAWVVALNAGAATTAMLLGMTVLLAGDFAHRLGADNKAARLATSLGAAALVAIPVVALSPLREAFGFLASPAQLVKAANWSDALALVGRSPLLGHGVGAWTDLAPSVLAESADLRRGYVESAVLQFALEHGLLALLALAAAMVVDVVPWLLGRGGSMSVPWRIVGAALLTTIGLEYTLGLGHQAAGVAVGVAALFGALSGTAQSQRRRARREAARPRPRAAALALDGAVLVTSLIAVFGVRAGVDTLLHGPEHEAAQLARGSTPAQLRDGVLGLAAVAPMNPGVVALGVAAAASSADDALAEARIGWLNTHAPTYAGTWGATLYLAQRQNDTARICEATRQLLDLGSRSVSLDPITQDPIAGASCLPASEPVRDRIFNELLRDQQALLVLRLADALLQQEPDSPAALEAGARAAVAARMPQGAVFYAAELRRVRPDSSEGWLLGAQAQRATSHPDALRILDEGIAAHPRDVELLLARADLLVEGAEADLATEDWRARVRDDLDAAAPGTVQRPALQRTHTLLRARIALIEGDPRRAGSVLDTLLERNANDIYTVRLRARAAAAAGDRRAAVLWWQRLLTLAPDDPEATRNLSER